MFHDGYLAYLSASITSPSTVPPSFPASNSESGFGVPSAGAA